MAERTKTKTDTDQSKSKDSTKAKPKKKSPTKEKPQSKKKVTAKKKVTKKKTTSKKTSSKKQATKTKARNNTAAKTKKTPKPTKSKQPKKKTTTKNQPQQTIKELLKRIAKKARGADLIAIKADAKLAKPKMKREQIFALAAKWDDYDLIRSLIDEGMDVNETILKIDKSAKDFTEFWTRNVRITRLLVENGLKGKTVGDRWLHAYNVHGPAEGFEMLLNCGAKFSKTKSPPLFVALNNKQHKIVKILLDRGMNPNSVQKDSGDTPLNVACWEGDFESVKLLLEAGADPAKKAKYDITPLHRASNGKQAIRVKIAELLLQYGADPNVGSGKRNPPLLSAASRASVEFVDLLLNNGADIEQKSEFGRTALISAAHENRADVIELLIERGANLDARYNQKVSEDYRGKNALEIAQVCKSRKAIKVLEQAMNARDGSGKGKKGSNAKPKKKPRVASVAQSWKRIENWLKENDPVRAKSLNKPVPEKQLKDAEKKLGISLPADVRESLKIHNGQKGLESFFMSDDMLGGSYYLLPIADVVREWKVWIDLVESGEFEGMESSGENGIKSGEWFRRRWIPVASNGGGDSYCIDLDADQGGKKGQVITMNHDTDTRELIASSWKALLSQYADDLTAGLIEFDE